LGFFYYLVLFAVVFKILYSKLGNDRPVAFSIMTFMLAVSMLQHNFYHVQTWLMLGLLLGYALSKQPAGTVRHQQPLPASRQGFIPTSAG
jgi:hypothetical protein